MKVEPVLGESGALLIHRDAYLDSRGFFTETWRESFYNDLGIEHMVQDNHSHSYKYVLRGMHFQKKPKEVAKLVKCINGYIYDVIVDIRPDSKTFKQWEGVCLDSREGNLLYIPKGFAHGFLTISYTADVIYKVSDYYSPDHDMVLRWDDPDINIKWDILKSINISKLHISDKDKVGNLIQDMMDIL